MLRGVLCELNGVVTSVATIEPGLLTFMMRLARTISVVLLVIAGNRVVLSKDWRGITPLHSTRADVERLLGPPAKHSAFGLYYNLPDEIAVIRLQNESCDADRFGLGWNVPIGTVTEIGTIPKRTFTKDRYVAGGDFKSKDVNAGFWYFDNDKDGLSVETYNGTVTLVTYSPTAAEANRRCPRVEECCVDFFSIFDEYGFLSFADEKARLDNFLIHRLEPMYRGALIVFGENVAERKKLLKRAQRAKQYLVQTRGLEPQRLLIIDGGYRGRSVTQLHSYMIDGEFGRIYLFPEKEPRKTSASQDLDAVVIDTFIAHQARRERGKEYREARDVLVGDLTHDGTSETVVLYTIEGQRGTNLYIQYLAIFVRQKGKLSALTHTDVGGKSVRSVELTSVENNSVLLKTMDYGPKDGACCPSVKGATTYVLMGRTLREQKRRSSRAVEPGARMKDEGSMGGSFSLHPSE